MLPNRDYNRNSDPERLRWWREARFGMFIHWGIYAVPAGVWKGEQIPSLGEWIMRNAKIPIEEYEKLAEQFNPVKFDADAWAELAQRAGMKYMVITAKHHDGFAMFHSPCNPYNIVDATPFGRDVMAELAEACARRDIKLCFYYSQAQDWHAPGGAGHWEQMEGNDWHQQAVTDEEFAQYLEEKAKPQVRELLTQYGPIGLIWFDTPVFIKPEQSRELRDLVHELQPDCLVSGRVGNAFGDYGSMGDNQIPCGPVEGDWETPATINDTWGYKSWDHNWKSVGDLLYLLVDLTSKGVNYLLNVGPTAEGEIPQPSVERLEAIGRWMDVNSEAIYGSSPSPFPYEMEWGRITARGDKLYLLFFDWPRDFRLAGLRNEVRRAYLPADPETDIPLRQSHDRDADRHSLTLDLPADAPDEHVSVVALELDGPADVNPTPQQQSSGRVSLPAHLAEMHRSEGSEITLTNTGIVAMWQDTGDRLSWSFMVDRPGEFDVRLILGSTHARSAAAPHQVSVTVDGQTVAGTLTNDEEVATPRAQYFPERATTLGRVTLDAPGEHTIELRAEHISDESAHGLTLAAMELTPAD
ncbi:MAG: alpha-L-fucosidase [Armatimonadetes bacterium]|nr:alpha-L-fucosidase [Armatimonadota bacterium]